MSNHTGIRLQVYMARCGVGSRRHCEQIILDGRVKVNGDPVTVLGTRVGPSDVVTFNGRHLVPVKEHVYVALNKPRAYLCANQDDRGRALASDLLRGAVSTRVFHVGRLDYLSTGLIFYTNDGEFARIVAHPASCVEKEYLVDTVQPVSQDQLDRYRRGLMVGGVSYRLRSYRLLDPRHFVLILEEGRNREIREVFRSFRVQLRRIHRLRIGPVTVKGLAPGQFRFLSAREVRWFLNRTHPRNSEQSRPPRP